MEKELSAAGDGLMKLGNGNLSRDNETNIEETNLEIGKWECFKRQENKYRGNIFFSV